MLLPRLSFHADHRARWLWRLAHDADVFLAEATFAEKTPADYARYLSTAREAGENALKAGVGYLLLTHLWPGTAPESIEDAARRVYPGDLAVAHAGLTRHLD